MHALTPSASGSLLLPFYRCIKYATSFLDACVLGVCRCQAALTSDLHVRIDTDCPNRLF